MTYWHTLSEVLIGLTGIRVQRGELNEQTRQPHTHLFYTYANISFGYKDVESKL